MGLAETMQQLARDVEAVGIATLILGLVVALVQAARILIGVKKQRRPTGLSGPSLDAAFCWDGSSWWPPTSYEPSPWSPLWRTLVSWGCSSSSGCS
jgi:hypothetical protein